MFYVYKTTCLVNGKFYIGKHKTVDLDDGYMGSGKLLLQAIKKYGKENFVTTILGCYDSDRKASIAERIFIVQDSEISYNLHEGGKGGWDYLHSIGNHGGRKKRPICFICKCCNNEVIKIRAVKSKKFAQIFCSKHCAGKYNSLHCANHISHPINMNNIETRKKHRNSLIAWHATKPLFNKQSKSNKLREAHKRNPKIWVTDGIVNILAFGEDLELLSIDGFKKGRIHNAPTIKRKIVLHSANGKAT